jgi:hypothetical protein
MRPAPGFSGARLALAAPRLSLLAGFGAASGAARADQLAGRTDRPLANLTANPVVALPAALQVRTETRPPASIAYGHDPLGRLASRRVGGNGSETNVYDAIHRLVGHTSDLGAFTLLYNGDSGQVASRASPKINTTWLAIPSPCNMYPVDVFPTKPGRGSRPFRRSLGEGGSGGGRASKCSECPQFRKHGGDFGAQTQAEYEQQAKDFLNGDLNSDTLEKVRPNNDVVRYNPKTNEFGVKTSSGTIRTYFSPDPAIHGFPTNLDYFNAQ